MKRKKRIFCGEKERRFREDKTRPQRGKASIKVDYGAFEKEIGVTFPNDSIITERIVDYTPNLNIERIPFGSSVLVIYKDSGKGFVYGLNGNFAGGFAPHDLRNLFMTIGAFLKKNRSWKRLRYVSYTERDPNGKKQYRRKKLEVDRNVS